MPTDDLTEDGPAYEVMYLLDAEDDAVARAARGAAAARATRSWSSVARGCGTSTSTSTTWAPRSRPASAPGGPHRVRVTHFAEQVEQARRSANRAHGPRTGRAVVVVALGQGLAEVFAEAGAIVVTSEVTRRPSAGQLVEAVRATGAAEVVLVPNSRDVLPAAEAAARLVEEEDAIRVAVVPTRAQVQGMAALAVHEPGRPFEQDLVEMTAAARHARSGRGHRRGPPGHHLRRPVRAGRRARCRRGRLRRGRARTCPRSRSTCSSACSAAAASW